MLNDANATNRQPLLDNVLDYVVGVLVTILPQIPLCSRFKAALMRCRGAGVGSRVKILPGVWIDRFKELKIGDDVSLAKDVIMVAAGGISIGDRTMIGYGSKLLSVNHRVPQGRAPMRFAGAELKPVTIAQDVWVGAGVIILPGVTVGEGSIVGAGAVVVRDVPPFAVVGGVPARVIRMREDADEDIAEDSGHVE